MTEEELKKRLDAYIEVTKLQVERDRAIEAAYFENNRLRDFAAATIKILSPLDQKEGSLSKQKLINLLAHAKNIATIDEAKELEDIKGKVFEK